MTIFYDSNNSSTGFDATATGVCPTGWYNLTGNWVTRIDVPNNTTNIQTLGSVNNTSGDCIIYNSAGAVADMEMTFTQQIVIDSNGQATFVAAGVRMSSTGSGYICAPIMNKNYVFIYVYSKSGSALTLLSGYSNIGITLGSIVPGTTYSINMRVAIVGSTIMVRMWEARKGESSNWNYQLTDTTIATPGYMGLQVFEDASHQIGVTDVILSSTPSGSSGTPETNDLIIYSPATISSPVTLTGSFLGAPTLSDLTISIDGAASVAITPAISGTTYTVQLSSSLSPGYHHVSVASGGYTGMSAAFIITGNYLTVNPPFKQITNTSVIVTGIYAGTVPTGINYSFNAGANWTVGTAFSAASGTWTATFVMPSAAGSYKLYVQEANAPTVISHTGTFSVGSPAGAAITVTTPTTVVAAGTPLPLSGTYTGVTPTGIGYYFDSSGTYSQLINTQITGNTWSGYATAPAAGSHTVTIEELNNTSVSAVSSSFTTSAATAGNIILMNNAAFTYDLWGWYVTSASANSINPGSIFNIIFTGNSAMLLMDISAISGDLPTLWYRIDNQAWTAVASASNLVLNMPVATAGYGRHFLEVMFKACDTTPNRWAPQNNGLVITGLSLDAGATVSATPVIVGSNINTVVPNILILGDGSVEGYRALNTGSPDVACMDAKLSWAHSLRGALGANISTIGFTGQGLSNGGNGGVPAAGSSLGFIFGTQSRSFAVVPDLVIVSFGASDTAGSSDAFVSGYSSFLYNLLAIIPSCPIMCLNPFTTNFQYNGFIQTAIAKVGNSRISFADASTFMNTLDTLDAFYPNGVGASDIVSPQVAALARSFISSGSGSYSYG